jgi:hypothetical protein
MKLKISYLILFTLIVNIFSANATIRFVSKTGTSTPPYTSWETAADSIQKCINICVDGDTIYVANGVYKENLVINTAISLIGSSMDSTVIDGTGLTDFTIEYNKSGYLENFKIFGKSLAIPNVIIFSVIPSNRIIINNCIMNEAGTAVGMARGDISVNNLIIYNVDRGVHIFGEEYNEVSNCIIIVSMAGSTGVKIGFAGSVVYKINNNIILWTGDPQFINPEYGITAEQPHRISIYNNLIVGFRENIRLTHPEDIDTARVINNVLSNQPDGRGSLLINGGKMIANNLILKNNRSAIYMFTGSTVISNYNLFWENEINYNSVTPGDSDIIADPMFVKDTIPDSNFNFDYHLQAFSPAIDKGNPDILDLDGTRSDIGMYGGPFGETYTYQDLAPLAPRNLSALVDTNSIEVKWNRNTEADTAFYKVYRDTVINFTIDSTRLISSQTENNYLHLPPYNSSKYVYKITCVDNQGNESKPSNELVVNVTSVSTNEYPMIISDYILYQNYPNPFNPSTKIGYQLKERAYVKLMVYDIKGELVSVLVNKEQNAGYYEVEFNVGNGLPSVPNLASGIYLYRIEIIGEGRIPVYTEMKKMLLIK